MNGEVTREYRPTDLGRCVAIVDEVWDFDGHLRPRTLADFVKRLYTSGSLAESRYARVIDRDGEVQAFLFGRAGTSDLYRNEYSGVIGRVRTLCRFLGLRGVGFATKLGWLRAIAVHQITRQRIEPVGEGEVTLFAAALAAQGKGYGRRLMDAYVDHCRELGIERLTVETDVESNYGFYDHYGFTRIGEFNSPTNQRFSGGSGRSFVCELKL
jgi:GNAT superfamily N-acetyltransferase